jgi:hypothetical protein
VRAVKLHVEAIVLALHRFGEKDVGAATERRFERFEETASGFFCDGSRFGDLKFIESLRNERTVPGTQLSVGALQSVARRQLVGSVIAAIVVAAVAGLAALRPPRKEAIRRGIQAPSLLTPPEHLTAAVKSATELP